VTVGLAAVQTVCVRVRSHSVSKQESGSNEREEGQYDENGDEGSLKIKGRVKEKSTWLELRLLVDCNRINCEIRKTMEVRRGAKTQEDVTWETCEEERRGQVDRPQVTRVTRTVKVS
jgi:hypothetical protein